ncbi:MAG TPA: M48 family metallopeptidase [Longimicrobiaceae bacterium]|nr:M48 family metallopeptidase [Longimicrobiaceae bacterium]
MSSTVAAAGSTTLPASPRRIQVVRWPTERPLFHVALLVSAVLWLLAAISVFGLLYAAFLGVFFFIVHLTFVAHVRGSGVRLGHDQFPELYARVHELAARMGMERVPEVYLMQAGGTLNALATRFLGANIVVLFSDLLEACGENAAARDMIIAHELGHIRAGHLRWHWFLLPAKLVPFLGTGLSRAREYTCDRYGLAGAGEREGALLGLTILAAGGTHGPWVNRQALVRQRASLNTGWMTLGEWLSSHPPLAKRLLMLDPSLGSAHDASRAGPLRALAILGLIFLPLGLGGGMAARSLPAWLDETGHLMEDEHDYVAPPPEEASRAAQEGFARLAAFLAEERQAGRPLPADAEELYDRWFEAYPEEEPPVDPYDGDYFGYSFDGTGYILWSSGPDQAPGTDDDVIYAPAAALAEGPALRS